MTVDRRALAGALAALLLVAACGGSATQSPTATPTPRATQAPGTETQAPGDTQEPTETQEPTNTDGPDVSLTPGGAPDLERTLPTEVSGVKFDRVSFDGESFPGGLPIDDDQMATFLRENGKTVKDVKVAMATASESSGAGTFVMAFQVEGVPSDKMLAWAIETLGSGSERTSVGGKDVYGTAMAGLAAYVYVKDDVVYYIFATGTPNLAEPLLQTLP